MRLFWRMSIGLVCMAVAASQKAPEPRSRRSEGRPDSALAFSRSDSLLLFSAKIALPPEGFSPADLPDANSVGAGLVAKYCVQCHALHTPAASQRYRLTQGGATPVAVAGPLARILRSTDSSGGGTGTAAELLTDYALVVSDGALPPCLAFVYERQQPGQPAS